jgi:phosphoglycolate phosphatase-like HAD superfamily hydrolase
MTRFPVLLFDVDGTLVDAGGAGRRALEAALEQHLGARVRPQEAWLAGMKLDGMTDRLIVREALLAVDHPFDERLCARILDSYAEHLSRQIHGPGYEVLPGVEALLEELSARRAPVGLCTGNVARGARLKLGRGGLDRYFGFEGDAIYGFAEDGEAREHIVAAAVRRASSTIGRPLAPEQALVIGDTPRDVVAAHAVGCRVLGVATGRHRAETLRAEGADHVVASLADPAAMALLLGA